MGKLTGDIAFLKRHNKRRVDDGKKQEIKPKRKKRKKDLEKLHRNAVEASKSSLIRVYRNGAKGKEVRKGNLPSSKFYKARLQGEIGKLLNRDTSTKSKDVLGSSPEIIYIDHDKKKKLVEEGGVSSEEDMRCSKRVPEKQLTSSCKYPWSAMFRYEEFCAIICSENFDEHSILPEFPDPIRKVKESLKRVHTNAMRQHFSRPDMNINDYITNLKNESSSKTPVDENYRVHVPNIYAVSGLSPNTLDSLTSNIVEDSHPETSQNIVSEVENKSHPSNIFFSVSKERPRAVRKTNVDDTKNFLLPDDIFDRTISTTTLSDDEDIVEISCERCAKRNINNIKCNARPKADDKLVFKNCTKYDESVEAKKVPSVAESERFTTVDKSSVRNLARDRAQTQKYIENLLREYKLRYAMQDSIDLDDPSICTNLSDRAMAWKATKGLKHVPGPVYDSTSATGLTNLPEEKHTRAGLEETLKKKFDFDLSVCPSGSSNERIISVQHVRANKRLENKHRTMKEKSSSSMYKRTNVHIPVESNIDRKNTKLNKKQEFDKSTTFRPEKSVTFSKSILINPNRSTQSCHDQNHRTVKSVNVDKATTTAHPVHYQIFHNSQPLLLSSKEVHHPEVTFINPTQYKECPQNSRDNIKSKPVYFQIINQPIKPRVEQNIPNQSLINHPTTTFTTCGQAFPNQTMIQQSTVPLSSQNVQFMFQENDPHVYTFGDLQNLKLLTLNDSQNVYINATNTLHEKKRANENAILQNVKQPTKYLAFEKDLGTHRIPIYFHNNNNDGTINHQFLPCKVITAVEKQNTDKVYFHDPSSQVILLQGNYLHDGNHQIIDPNYKHLI